MALSIYRAIDAIIDAYNIEMPENYKRRDPVEPGRALKEQYEDKLGILIRRRFRTQKKQIREVLDRTLPHKNVDDWERRLDDGRVWEDEETDALIISLFYGMMMDGSQIFDATINIGVDWGGFNAVAVEQARKQYLGLIKGIDDVTRESLREALVSFAEVPGYTIGDVMSSLPFQGYRAQRIAVTETTRMFALAEQTAIAELQKQYPDMKVVKTWFTNADDIVCEICGPMEGQTVDGDGMFVTADGVQISMPPAHPNCRCWMQGGVDV